MNIKLPSVEILVATMHRTSLDFLWKMFTFNNHADFNILIVNQTTIDKQLISNYDHINVINSFEFGVPKSRNLAISKATAELCLMADDDIVYQPNLKIIITDAYLNHPDAAMISFEAMDKDGFKYANYSAEGTHNKETLRDIYTWVISFNRMIYKRNDIYYNSHFGFGSIFQGCEEYVFLRNAYDKKLKMVHVSNTIVQHPNESSGRLMGSDNAVYSRAAMMQRFYGNLSYLWLFKYVFFIRRHKFIRTTEIIYKYQLGLRGIDKYKKLKISGEIDKIYEA